MPTMVPHCFPRPTALAPVETEIINASAAAIETNSPVFILASLDAVLLDNHRLHLSREWWNDCEMDHAGGARCPLAWSFVRPNPIMVTLIAKRLGRVGDCPRRRGGTARRRRPLRFQRPAF